MRNGSFRLGELSRKVNVNIVFSAGTTYYGLSSIFVWVIQLSNDKNV